MRVRVRVRCMARAPMNMAIGRCRSARRCNVLSSRLVRVRVRARVRVRVRVRVSVRVWIRVGIRVRIRVRVRVRVRVRAARTGRSGTCAGPL